MFKKILNRAYEVVNNIDPMIAENWAVQAIANLVNKAKMIYAVDRSYENAFSSKGQVVHLHKVLGGSVHRKTRGSNYRSSQVEAVGFNVTLDQHLYWRTFIDRSDLSYSFENLFQKYGEAGVTAIIAGIEEALTGKALRTALTTQSVGKLGVALSNDAAITLNKRFRDAKADDMVRYAFVNSQQEAELIAAKLLVTQNTQTGNNVLEQAVIGKLFNTMFVPTGRMPYIVNSDDFKLDVKTAAVKGATALEVDGTNLADAVAGCWITIAGEGKPHFVSAMADHTTYKTLTLWPALEADVAADAVITATTPGVVANLVVSDGTTKTTFPGGWTEEIGVNFGGAVPAPCQIVSVGAPIALDDRNLPTNVYGAMSTGDSTQLSDRILLSSNLAASAAAGVVVGKGPSGGYGVALCPEALTMVSRPLTVVASDTNEAFANAENVVLNTSIRVDNGTGGYYLTYETLFGCEATRPELIFAIYN